VQKPGDLPWTVTPESVRAVPPPPISSPSPPPAPAPRRTPSHSFRLLDEDEEKKPAPKPRRRKRRGPWLRRVAILLLLAGAGAGGYWYVVLRNPGVPPPWTGLLDRAKQLVARVTARKPTPPAPRRRPVTAPAPTAATAPLAAVPPPAAAPVPAPVPVPQPVAPASPFARFDRLSDSLSRAVRNFQDRAALFASGRMDCGGLASGLVSVENLWSTYNVERRARMASFDARRATQDQAMYAAVDAVESGFERSGCPRP